MMHRNKTKLLILIIIAISAFIIIACSVKQKIILNTDGSGSFYMDVALADEFIQYLLDVGEASGAFESSEEIKIFDRQQIITELSLRPGIMVKNVNTPSIGQLKLELSFKNIEDIFNQGDLLKNSNLIVISGKERKNLKFNLNKQNFNQLTTLFPFLSTPEFEYFLPQTNETRAEYLEAIDFALDNGSKLLKESVINISVKINGQIISQTGGEIKNNLIIFKIPLVDILFLDDPIKYSIIFE